MENLKEKIEAMPDSNVYSKEEMWKTIEFIRTTLNGPRTPLLAIGEFAELISAVADYESRPDKRAEGEIDIYSIIDEMADAKLLLMSLQQHYGISDDLLDKVCTLKLFHGKQKAYKKELHERVLREVN